MSFVGGSDLGRNFANDLPCALARLVDRFNLAIQVLRGLRV